VLSQIHKTTVKSLGQKAETIVSGFRHELGKDADPAYFAPYLKSNRRILGLSEALVELASLEWSIYYIESQVGAWKHGAPQDILTLNPSLNLLRLQFDVWSVLKNEISLAEAESRKHNHVLAVYQQPLHRLASFCKILPEWALVIDVLTEGSYERAELIQAISKKYNVLFPKTQIQNIIDHLQDLHIIEQTSSSQ
jgi:hypothetical protein